MRTTTNGKLWSLNSGVDQESNWGGSKDHCDQNMRAGGNGVQLLRPNPAHRTRPTTDARSSDYFSNWDNNEMFKVCKCYIIQYF